MPFEPLKKENVFVRSKKSNDLARNDLSRSAENVKVETFKEVQFYSHVIHLVSKVTGRMHQGTNPLQLVADTFPAGTFI